MTALFQAPTWQVLAGFGFGPLDPDPLFVDIAGFMRTYGWDEGKQHELDRMEAATLDLLLNNNFGELTPGNTLSPYYNLLNTEDALGLTGSGGTWVVLSGGGAIANQGTEVIWGPFGGRITGNASAATVFSTAAGTSGYAVNPLINYTANIQVRANTTAESLSASIAWYTSSGTLISTSAGTAQTDSTSAWTMLTVSGVAPANAAFAAVRLNDGNHTTHQHYFTCCMLSRNPYAIPVTWGQGQVNPLVVGVPIQLVGNWASTPVEVAYAFSDTWEPNPKNMVMQDTALTAYDVLGLLGRTPLSNSKLFPDQVTTIPGCIGYWRCNDPIAASQAAPSVGPTALAPQTPSGLPQDSPPFFGSQDTTGAGLAQLLSSSFSGSGSGALLYDTATCVTFTPFDAAGTPNESLVFPAGATGFSDGDPWSMHFLANFGSDAGAAFFQTYTSAGGLGMYMTIEDGTISPSNIGQIGIWYNGGTSRAYSGVSVIDNLWHQIMITFDGTDLIVSIDNVAVLGTTLTSSCTPVGAGPNSPSFKFYNQIVTPGNTPTTALQEVAIWDVNIGGTAEAELFTAYHLLQNTNHTGERVGEVLRIAGFAAYPNIIERGNILCQPETASQTATAALDYIGTITDTELGFFFQTADGVLNFRDSTWAIRNPKSITTNGVLADTDTADMNYIAKGLKVVQDGLDLYSDYQVQANQYGLAGVLQEVVVSSAVGPPGGFGYRPLQRTGLLFFNDSDALRQAQVLAARYSNPKKRVDGVTLKGESAGANNLLPMLQRALWDRITFGRQAPGESPFSDDMLIEHRSLTWDASTADFGCTWILSPYEVATPMSIIVLAAATPLVGSSPPVPNGPWYDMGGETTISFVSGFASLPFPAVLPNGLLEFVLTNISAVGGAGAATLSFYSPSLSGVEVAATIGGVGYTGGGTISWHARGW